MKLRYKCDNKNNGLLLVQKTRWYHISVSFVMSIYSGLGLGQGQGQCHPDLMIKNTFSKLKKKIQDFSCTHAPGHHFENNNNKNNNNYNYYLLQRIQQSDALHLQYLHYKSTLKKEIYT